MYHLQSYFLYFRGQDVIKDVQAFFETTDPVKYTTKEAVINACEIGLSQYLLTKCKRRLKALFPAPTIAKALSVKNLGMFNPSYKASQYLRACGCPLIKKKIYGDAS
jgi:hypothetical protein